MTKGQPTPAPPAYILIRLFFRLILNSFYGSIVVENAHYIPQTGKPCILCSNHSNSVIDAPLVSVSVPMNRRKLIRFTAKASLFGKKTFSSWLIQAAGTIPIQRRKDNADGSADNAAAMESLMDALEAGDAICLFPEGISRYHPEIAPLKTGVARMVSDALGRNRDDPEFEVHRQHFRSDVLVTWNKPMIFSVKNNPELLPPVDFARVREVTQDLQERIRSGILEAPTWDHIRNAKVAARIYAPLGTLMPLGEYVRLSRRFADVFANAERAEPSTLTQEEKHSIVQLCKDLKAYQDELVSLGVKDDRVRKPLRRPVIIYRMAIRLLWSLVLLVICLPGLVLWAPVFITSRVAVHKFMKKGGPVYDTWDDISQHKALYGLGSVFLICVLVIAFTWRISRLTIFITPIFLWMSMRWIEDGVATFRAFTSLYRLLRIGKLALKQLRERRAELHSRVMNLAVESLGLPADPEKYFSSVGGKEKGRVRGTWDHVVRYFSVKRRRKRDWNETLRLYDKVDYPVDDYPRPS
ncbi:hypothetical protein NMY22_g5648 [Coprinellus aureogranulatus]|nr:hypothetical protein NMY22_g5648 [Coprinellus aureogranulatus]